MENTAQQNFRVSQTYGNENSEQKKSIAELVQAIPTHVYMVTCLIKEAHELINFKLHDAQVLALMTAFNTYNRVLPGQPGYVSDMIIVMAGKEILQLFTPILNSIESAILAKREDERVVYTQL